MGHASLPMRRNLARQHHARLFRAKTQQAATCNVALEAIVKSKEVRASLFPTWRRMPEDICRTREIRVLEPERIKQQPAHRAEELRKRSFACMAL